MSTHNIPFSIYKKKITLNYLKSAYKGTQERVRNSCSKRAISIQATVVLLYSEVIFGSFNFFVLQRTEHQLSQAWNKWHMAYTKRKAMKKVEAFERKQSLTMVFVSWRNLCKKRRMRGSMIPLPVSPAFSMPSAGTSSSSTPTEEVLSSPTFGFSGKPSQIPAPSSRRSKLPSYSGKTSTNNSHDAGSSTSRRASAL